MQIINVIIKERMHAVNKRIKSLTWNRKSLKSIPKTFDWLKTIIWTRNFIVKRRSWILHEWTKW